MIVTVFEQLILIGMEFAILFLRFLLSITFD